MGRQVSGVGIVTLPKKALRTMSSRADDAIANVLSFGSIKKRTPPRTEVGLVAAVTLNGIGAIARAWKPALSKMGRSVNIHGVFCHGKPEVDFKRTRCELADILIVIDRKDSGQLVRRATLIQAKMAGRQERVYLTGTSSHKQLNLYQNWPSFTFADESLYGDGSFDLAKSANGMAGSFGIIDRHLTSSKHPIWTQHSPNPTPSIITTQPKLGSFLTGMFAGQPGFGRYAPQKPKDDWSRLLDLLLKVTYARTFAHKLTLGDQRPPRGLSAFIIQNGQSRNIFAVQSTGEIPPIDLRRDIPDRPTDTMPSLVHIEIEEEL
jgi:hypothetical protein